MKSVSNTITTKLTPFARSCILRTLAQISWGRLDVTYKDQGKDRTVSFGKVTTAEEQQRVGNKGHGNDAPQVSVVIKDESVWVKLCVNLDLEIAEAFMLRQVECSDLRALFTIYYRNAHTFGANGSLLFQLVPRVFRLLVRSSNTVPRSLQNATFHYDTSNTLFAAFLSGEMAYSCPIWASPPTATTAITTDPKTSSGEGEAAGKNEDGKGGGEGGESLASAQRRKVHTILHLARVEAGDHVLDIGGGWGYLAIEAARSTGCRVTMTTLAAEQKALAEQRARDAGLQERVEVLLCDYRQTPRPREGYDAVVSMGMVEHVGEKHLGTYWAVIARLLKRGGTAVVDGITVTNEFQSFRGSAPDHGFIERYVFPGGYLPTINDLLSSLHTGTRGTLEVETVQNTGPHYALALKAWRENFLKNWAAIRKSYTETRKDASEEELEALRRKWIYYFCCCEAGFRTGRLGNHIVTAVKQPGSSVEK